MNLLIIHPEGNIKNNPNLYAFTKELVKNGYNVIILSLLRPGIYQGELFPGARMEFYGQNRAENLIIKLQLIRQDFCHIIGVDQGIIEAARIAKVLNIKYSFLSYEIFFDNELIRLNNITDLKYKRKSKKACKKIQFAVVQDEVRSLLLTQQYFIPKDKIMLMPVAGTGIRPLEKTNYFHVKLKIPAGKKILLYMGWIDEFQINRLTDYVAYIPENWAIVVHSRYKFSGKLPENFKADKIYFSLESPIENIDDLGILLSGCDAGFCTYKPTYDTPFTGDNIKYIGLSSGKTSTFLQYGVPVIVENMNLWDMIVSEYKIGFILCKPSDLKQLDFLLAKTYRDNCFNYFDQRLDLKNYYPEIISRINSSFKTVKPNRIIYLFWLFSESFGVAKQLIKNIFK